MPTITDYLDWRGDIGFDYAPMNEVDCYIICKLGSPDLTGLVPEDGGCVPLEEAARRFSERAPADRSSGLLTPLQLLPILRRLPETARFRDLALSGYINRVDMEKAEQFSALTVHLPGGGRFVTFRGTDDTLAAWRENLSMSVEAAVPAQLDAADYLVREAARGPGPLFVGGHSKGGNLAVYAAVHAPAAVQARIAGVYNFDGPGFREPVSENPAYRRIRHKLLTLVPRYAIVGLLLNHGEDFEIVACPETGIAAHNGFNWEVLRDRFVRCDSFAKRSRLFMSAASAWEAQLDMARRQAFIDALFDVLTSTGATTLTDLTEHRLRQSVMLVQNLRREPEVRELLTDTLELLLKDYVSSARLALPRPSLPGRGRFRRKDKK